MGHPFEKALRAFDWDLLGFGIARAWITLCFIVSAPLCAHGPVDRLLFFAFGALACAGISLLAGCRPPARVRTLALVASALFAITGLVLVTAAVVAGSELVALSGMVLCGMGAALLQVCWGDKIACQPTEKVDTAVTASFVVAAALALGMPRSAGGTEAALLLLFLLPAASFILLYRGFAAGQWAPAPPETPAAEVAPAEAGLPLGRFAMSVLAFAFVYNFARGQLFANPASLPNGQLFLDMASVAVPALLLLAVARAAVSHRMALYRLAFTVLIGALVALAVSPERLAGVITVGADLGYRLFDILFWCVLVSTGSLDRSRSLLVTARAAAVNFAGIALGLGAAALLPRLALSPDVRLAVILVLAFALVVVVMLILPESVFAQMALGHRKQNAPSSQAGAAAAASSRDKACAAAAERGRLTPRERDVLALLAQGRTQASIARKLTISENTAHSHITHVYQKLSVHSQQELLDLLDGHDLIHL